MYLRHYRPLPGLQHFINRIMLVDYHLDCRMPKPVNPFPPQPEQCLYFYPRDKISSFHHATQVLEEQPRCMLIGPQLTRVDLTIGYNMLVIMVGFHPGGMYRLLGVPMEELFDRPFDAALFFGSEIGRLTEQLGESTDYDAMVQLIQQYLLKKAGSLSASLPIDRVLMQNGSPDDVDLLAKQACVSIRQLERQFKERIGMPPKVYSRLTRFSKAWFMRESNAEIPWISIAHSCGYSDQMHMIRDFKDFAGVTPVTLQKELNKSPLRLQRDSIKPASF